MAPKEKALELKEQFDGYTCYALKAVNEIQNTKAVYHNDTEYDYWEEVKQELETL